jgi:hypothetical protein
VWAAATQQPVLLLDDSLAPNMLVTPADLSSHLMKSCCAVPAVGPRSSRSNVLPALPAPNPAAAVGGTPSNAGAPLRTSRLAQMSPLVKQTHLVVFVHGYQVRHAVLKHCSWYAYTSGASYVPRVLLLLLLLLWLGVC